MVDLIRGSLETSVDELKLVLKNRLCLIQTPDFLMSITHPLVLPIVASWAAMLIYCSEANAFFTIKVKFGGYCAGLV